MLASLRWLSTLATAVPFLVMIARLAIASTGGGDFPLAR